MKDPEKMLFFDKNEIGDATGKVKFYKKRKNLSFFLKKIVNFPLICEKSINNKKKCKNVNFSSSGDWKIFGMAARRTSYDSGIFSS